MIKISVKTNSLDSYPKWLFTYSPVDHLEIPVIFIHVGFEILNLFERFFGIQKKIVFLLYLQYFFNTVHPTFTNT